ncbi:4a-hydroxytetrahydrobiopterin dehydratase [Candidatus Woesebacteria bacterium RIFCSPHIGHO2_01_FULL_39_32]|uniref:4a-hydroxytetrahydrobiopterin dehydratase n=2 Tax=Candidatus Woeseibacteriota TaxID=1752722 RepID=A0A0G0PL57_9BACT|nr:MAG: Threonine synthase [Candidatus Woesebacteria bacterium GW2011_GWA1_39_8]OGM05581.1 MAG: 4a-hydroxytetrahydrobiopterin dehydratase [Candidatus Woesebacteria bacterium GWB1_37_5]OGM25543.1 MAG: 4a-hydroxytetrahydrobiopterin dehydratase [Candidatus Woesebacteria bacterium RIFCSPHIGHO2_01_FULL_39_32]OGM36823.1 MAG: 4a-hydroxytetrahydrobiopterin dehydratase [Candidatus Woesebacteria bacterium RIFCSPHIGHO2_12_FULL_38_11]OGM65074.1 MAG: 4a-hydroxytetrahydrobiopterin dehydratase [Candidatus Woe
MDLTKIKCVPCRGGEPTLSSSEIKKYLGDLKNGWKIETLPDKLVKEFEFKDFKEAIKFTNKVAALAEEEGHHPNIYIHSYKKVKLELWTHKIGGLHQNDFVMAAKINEL